jgi:hypothetical protein
MGYCSLQGGITTPDHPDMLEMTSGRYRRTQGRRANSYLAIETGSDFRDKSTSGWR